MLPHGEAFLLIILVYFIIVSIVLTMLYRIVIALDKISARLLEIARELGKITSRKDEK